MLGQAGPGAVWPARQASAGDMLLLKTQRPPDCRGAGTSPQLDTCHVTEGQQEMGRTGQEEGEEEVILCRNVLRAARAG